MSEELLPVEADALPAGWSVLTPDGLGDGVDVAFVREPVAAADYHPVLLVARHLAEGSLAERADATVVPTAQDVRVLHRDVADGSVTQLLSFSTAATGPLELVESILRWPLDPPVLPGTDVVVRATYEPAQRDVVLAEVAAFVYSLRPGSEG